MSDGADGLTRRPTRTASAVALGGGFVALATTLAGAETAGLFVGVLGIVALLVGLVGGFRRGVDVGAFVLFAGVVVTAISGVDPRPALLGTVGAVVAWDSGRTAVELGIELGREARTRRLELVQASTTIVVGLAAAAVGYGVYVVAWEGQPEGALVFFLVAAAFVTVGLGARRGRRAL